MQEDFHYYATYCASYLAGYSHEESMAICYSAQFVDLCSRTLLEKLEGPLEATTTQLKLELMEARTDPVGLQDITRIWSSFHFLPRDLNAQVKGGKKYRNKYRLICGPNGELVKETVELAKGRSLQAVGLAMHVLADTWAHRYFAGTPSLVINNTDHHFFEIIGEGEDITEHKIVFRHSATVPDDLENRKYTNSVTQRNENSIMNLGHGRAGHLPDYSFARYRYLPAWGKYMEVVKDNPSDYFHAFSQMVYALRFLRGDLPAFAVNEYDLDTIRPYISEIKGNLTRRQLDACAEWKALGERLSGQTIDDFDLERYQQEYMDAPKGKKEATFLGQFFLAALMQKSMVTNRIFTSGNGLAGVSVDFRKDGVKGMKDFAALVNASMESSAKDVVNDLQRFPDEGFGDGPVEGIGDSPEEGIGDGPAEGVGDSPDEDRSGGEDACCNCDESEMF